VPASVNSFQWSVPLLIFCFVASSWVLICYSSSALTGWYRLSQRFTAEQEPNGPAKSAGPFFYAVYMRWWSHYSCIVRITAAEDALYLSVASIYRPGHPPLAIPWSEIAVGIENHFLRTYINLRLGRSEQIPLRLSESVANQLGLYQRFPQLGACDMPSEKDFTTLTDDAAARIAREVIHRGDDSTR